MLKATLGPNGLTGTLPELEWDTPDQLGAVPDMPVDMLPPVISDWIQRIAETYSCQRCVPACLFMTALSGVVGSRIGIRPYRQLSLLIYPNFWGGVVGDPGTGKTPIMNATMAPFDVWNRRISDSRKSEKAAREAELDAISAEVAALKSDLGDATDADKTTIKGQLEELYIRRDSVPKKGRYGIVQDCTAEAMAELMRDNPGGIVNIRDEIAGFLRPLDNESAGGARSFMIEAQNGGRPFTQHRIKRGDVEIPSVTLTLIGGIQPAKLASYIADAISADSDRNDGLVQRLQMVPCPASLPFIVNDSNDEPPQDVISRILEIDDALPHQVDEQGQWKPLLINVNEGAHDAWAAWVQTWMDEVVSVESQTHIKGHLSKFRTLMPSLALLFALLDARDTVTAGDMDLAGRWCDYMQQHARRMYSLGQSGGTPVDVFIEKIKAGKITDGMAVGEITHAKILGRATTKVLPGVITTLTKAGWIQIIPGSRKKIIRINPLIIKQLGVNNGQ
ncbi:DUF3987 domain-containing protein [Mariprofundus ferrooxydans]|uniref:DUF3987 domain-containing protein n=1 Tax=Mariprofundus ferrooxydans TaxID=314344 RepID=UPI0014306B33|nr:DUF3987 domain-containing protein [Mariprofundus ferrooxydans]